MLYTFKVGRGGLVAVGVAVGVVAGLLGGCSSAPKASAGMSEENAVVHHVSEAEMAAAHSKEAIHGTSAVLWVNGLGCPQCATNIDMQLKRVPSVVDVRTDLGQGKVFLTLSGKGNPSAHTLSERTLDAGFTLVKVESN